MNNVDMSNGPTVRFNLENVGGNDEDNGGKFNGHSRVKTSAPQKCITNEPGDGQQKSISLNQRRCADKQPALPIDQGSSSVIDGKSIDQKPNHQSETPLHIAERQRSTNVLQILKKNDEFSEDMVNTARKGNAERLQFLISKQPDESTLNNALQEAAKSGQNHCLEILIKAGAKNLDEALLAAAAQGQAHCLHPLIRTDDKVKVLNMALCEAARHGQTQCLKPLINQGANNLIGALCAAAEQGQSKSLQLLLKEGAENLNLNDVLYFAVLTENDEFRDALINNGADITTVLHTAAVKDSVDQLNNQFISAYINTPNKYGRTPLHISAAMGHTKSLEKLLKTDGVKINTTDKSGHTPLHFAVFNMRTDTAMMLLKADNIDVNVKDKNHFTALHYAINADNSTIVEELLKTSDIAVNEGGEEGWTPLHAAAYKNIPDAVRQLLAIKDTKVNQKDNHGDTALHLAVKSGNTNIVEMLLDTDVGIEVKEKNNSGQTALDLADDNCRKLLKDFLKANKH